MAFNIQNPLNLPEFGTKKNQTQTRMPITPDPNNPIRRFFGGIGNIFKKSMESRQVNQSLPSTTKPSMFGDFKTTNVGGFTVPKLFGGAETPAISPQAPVQPPVTPVFNPQAVPQVITPTPTTPPTTTMAPTPMVTPPQATTVQAPVSPLATPQVETTQTSTPAIPQLPENAPEETKTAVASAEKAVMEAAKISPEELSTQADLDKLIESTKTAFLNTSNQPIPLEFITGQLKSVENRALNLAEPLERKLARLQAERTSALEASEFALDRADKKAEKEAKKKTEITTDTFINEKGETILFDKTTGDIIKNLGRKFEKSTETDFTLSPEEVRFDKQGNIIARGGEKPMSETAQAKAIEAEEKAKESQSAVLDNLNLVNILLENPALTKITGIKGPSAFFPGTEAQTAKNLFKQIKASLSIGERQKLKGSGAISDFEAKTLSESASALDTNLSNESFKDELRKIRGVFATASGGEAKVRVRDPNTGETIEASASREEINQLIAEGNIVEYR